MNVGTSFVPTSSTRLCSEHFTKECFEKKDTRTFLRVSSIPTLFVEYRTCAYCNAIQDDDKNVSFRKFPLNNSELLEKWITALKLGNYIPRKKSIICTKHFSKDCFYTARTGYLRLKENAVPSILETTEDTHNSEDQAASAEESRANCSSVLSKMDIEMENDENCDTTNDNSITEIVTHEDDSEERPSTSSSQCTPRSLNRKRNCTYDHSYELSPNSMKRKISRLSATVKRLRAESKVHNRRIQRLKKKITSLNDLLIREGISLIYGEVINR